MPAVSVIIPCHNVEMYIESCVVSICGQSLEDLELICVDDGSTDGTGDLLDKLARGDKRIRVVHQENQGAGGARNTGLALARGDYFSILDSDDLFNKKMLETAYVKALLTNADVVLYKSNQFLQKEDCYRETPWAIKRDQLPNTEVFSMRDIAPNAFFAFQGWTWDKLFRASLILDYGLKFQTLRIYNDMSFTFSACLLAHHLTYVDHVLIHQRKRGGGSLSDNPSPYWDCLFDALAAVDALIKDTPSLEPFRGDFDAYVLHMVRRQLEINEGEDKKRMREAISSRWKDEFPALMGFKD